MLTPWQRAMAARRQQRFEQAARALARQIAMPPPPPNLVFAPGPIEFVDYLDNTHVYDPDCSPDQMAWQVEDELEKWDEFVKELKQRKKRD